MAKAITIKDIAQLSGVSITTVSRVLNDKAAGISQATIDRVRETIAKTNYQPNSVARSMITKRSNTIGLILPDVRNPFFSELARGVEDICNDHSFGCFLCNTDGSLEKENEYIRLLRGRVAEGILFTTQNTIEFNQTFLDFMKKKYPFCFIERYIDELPDIPGIYVDNYRGAVDMTEFILSKGHRRVAFISGPLTTHNARMRRDGYLDTLRSHGIPVDESLVIEGNYRYSGGYNAAATLLGERGAKFTALFAANDLMALGAYKYLEEAGFRVPDDISVAGYDNISYPPVLKPTITTIEIPAYELGRRATEMLFKLLEGEQLAEPRITFTPQLRDKGSIRQI